MSRAEVIELMERLGTLNNILLSVYCYWIYEVEVTVMVQIA